jgi:cysteine desulfurase
VDNTKLLAHVAGKVSLSIASACQSQSKTPSYVLQALGLDSARQHSSVRIGIGRFTTQEEITFAAKTLIDSATGLGKTYA